MANYFAPTRAVVTKASINAARSNIGTMTRAKKRRARPRAGLIFASDLRSNASEQSREPEAMAVREIRAWKYEIHEVDTNSDGHTPRRLMTKNHAEDDAVDEQK